MFEAIFICEAYHSLELMGCPLSMKISMDIPLWTKSSVKWLLTAVTLVEDIWNRKEYLDKQSMINRYLLSSKSMKFVQIFCDGHWEHHSLSEELLEYAGP